MKQVKLLCLFLAFTLFVAGCRKKPAGAVTPLHRAAEQGDIEQVRSLIASGADINARDYQGLTPIHRASGWTHGHEVKSLEVVKVLVAKGADVNAESNGGITPMKCARKYGTEAIRSYLQAHGASD